jgi:hypothetical protein
MDDKSDDDKVDNGKSDNEMIDNGKSDDDMIDNDKSDNGKRLLRRGVYPGPRQPLAVFWDDRLTLFRHIRSLRLQPRP